ncbi:MAG: rRNA pseudouridine synthase [Eggerthellaceae bacterium]|nr:rRNA pseudouridine synthase [Eggerthellaceae bacterium]
MIIRLDKYLSDMGLESRSGAKELIRKGNVRINGVVVSKADTKIDTERDTVTFKEEDLSYHEFEYYLLNKPAGIISASNDIQATTVIDLIEENHRTGLFPVGRLDKNTTGLLLITNDGALAHRLLSPGHHVSKTYEAILAHEASNDDIEAFAQGIDIGDEKLCLPAKLIIDNTEATHVTITIEEGRYHQIKRMFEARNNEVIELKRISMGPLVLDESLKEGQYRTLSDEELNALKSL